MDVKSLGCFKDTGRRAIPGVDGRYSLVKGYYRRRADAIKKCASVAMMLGHRCFGVQHQGWCATSRKACQTYGKYGRTNRCKNGKGGPWANDVYRIYGELALDAFHWLLTRVCKIQCALINPFTPKSVKAQN
ncbi:hypothetical protein OS493_008686 [Desmophyllum pertusum]|uniref:Uncharacterized protein n=1 Tax=Desmophyllum pertusum TaxID=174260 RepID=A0A9X0D6D4_9CNID|nr:hypothetical protein OS493_008686 [Desmophyllum pertusum]